MSHQSTIGKRAWQRRAGSYAADLREDIEQESRWRFAAWQARGRQPMWLGVKRALQRAGRAMVVWAR